MTTLQGSCRGRSHRVAPQPDSYQGATGHIVALDGLRGLAIALVLIYHFTLDMGGHGLVERIFLKATSAGWCGVDLFFVLSGFLITGILCETRESAWRFRDFYARRALRIFPLYYGTLIVIFAALPWIGKWIPTFEGVEGASVWLWSYGTNILVALRGEWFPLSHFWSLAVEEHYYLIWPAVVYWSSRRTSIFCCIGMIVLATAARAWLVADGAVLAAYCLTVCRMDALAMGSLLALTSRGPGGPGALVPLARMALLMAGAAILGLGICRFGLNLFDAAIQTAGYFALDVFFASLLVLIVAAPPGSRLVRVFSLAPLRFLGRYSYGLYVYNSIFLLAAEGTSLLPRLIVWSGSATLGRGLYMALAAQSTLAAAWLSWHLVEKRFLPLKRFFRFSARPRESGAVHDVSRHTAPRAAARAKPHA